MSDSRDYYKNRGIKAFVDSKSTINKTLITNQRQHYQFLTHPDE